MRSRSRGSKSRRIRIGGPALALEDVERVAAGAGCALAPEARTRVTAARAVVEQALMGDALVYGVNTGFGHLATVRIADADLAELQRNLVRSHAAGVGRPLDERIVRAVLTLRAHCLARGHSGVRIETIELMIELLDAGVVPIVPEQGSVGASGDLAPLAHLTLALIGEGQVLVAGHLRPAREALHDAGLAPLALAPKEGIALINGTQVMTAIGTLALLDAERLARTADVVGAMTIDALLGSHRAFDARIHHARPHPGQAASAANLRRLLANSTLEASHRDCGRVQDAYSLRCLAQVHGAVRDGLAFVRRVLEIEIDSSTDNPMVFAEHAELVSGGNFHGQPVASALDHLAVAAATIATISERRIERLVNPDLSGLPAFLTRDPGLHSGFMMAHVTAAALVSENKVLAHPASVDTVPTSAAKEDHVSMGLHAARKAAQVVDNVRSVLAIEALCAAQALDLRAPLKAGRGAEAARRAVRRRVSGLGDDRALAPDIEAARALIAEGRLTQAAERACGQLL